MNSLPTSIGASNLLNNLKSHESQNETVQKIVLIGYTITALIILYAIIEPSIVRFKKKMISMFKKNL